MKKIEICTSHNLQLVIFRLVNRTKDEAIQNINTAQGNDDVTEAQNNGTNTIQQVPLTPVKRQNAIATINAKADEQKRLIQANNNATTEEKAAATTELSSLRNALLPDNVQSARFTTTHGPDLKQISGTSLLTSTF